MANTERAREWRQTKGRGSWLSNLVNQTLKTPIVFHELDRMDCDTDVRLRLLDLLPSFMNLTAARSAMGTAQAWQATDSHTSDGPEVDGEWAITAMWQRLAVKFMSVAAAEHWGEPSWSCAVLEVFAWGDAPASFSVNAQEKTEKDGAASENVKLRELFFDHGGSPASSDGSNTWHDIHAAALAEALDENTNDNDTRLDSHSEFRRNMCHFLSSLHESQTLPLLAQLEIGNSARIDFNGIQLSKEDIQSLRIIVKDDSK